MSLKEETCGANLMYDSATRICSASAVVIQKRPECQKSAKSQIESSSSSSSNLALLLRETSSLSKELSLDFLLTNHQDNSIKFSSFASIFGTLGQGKLDQAALASLRGNVDQLYQLTQLLKQQPGWADYSLEQTNKIEQLRTILNGVLHEMSGSSTLTTFQKNIMTTSKQVQIIRNTFESLSEDSSNQYLIGDMTAKLTSLTGLTGQLNSLLYQSHQPNADTSFIFKRLTEIRAQLEAMRLPDYGSTTITNSYNTIINLFGQVEQNLGIKQNIVDTSVDLTCDPAKLHTPHPDDCQAFYMCVHSKRVVKKCGPGTLFNPTRMICDWPLNVYKIRPECKASSGSPAPAATGTTTPSTRSVPTTTQGKTTTISAKEETSTTTLSPVHQASALIKAPGDECDVSLINTIFPDDCQAFFHCDGVAGRPGKAVKKMCGPGTLFHPVTMICDWPASVFKVRPECDPDNRAQTTTATARSIVDGGLLFTIGRDTETSTTTTTTKGGPARENLVEEVTLPKTTTTTESSILILQSTKTPPLACPKDGYVFDAEASRLLTTSLISSNRHMSLL